MHGQQGACRLTGTCSLASWVHAPQMSFSGGFVSCAVAKMPCTLTLQLPAWLSACALQGWPSLNYIHQGLWLQVTDLLQPLASKASTNACTPSLTWLLKTTEHSLQPCLFQLPQTPQPTALPLPLLTYGRKCTDPCCLCWLSWHLLPVMQWCLVGLRDADARLGQPLLLLLLSEAGCL